MQQEHVFKSLTYNAGKMFILKLQVLPPFNCTSKIIVFLNYCPVSRKSHLVQELWVDKSSVQYKMKFQVDISEDSAKTKINVFSVVYR